MSSWFARSSSFAIAVGLVAACSSSERQNGFSDPNAGAPALGGNDGLGNGNGSTSSGDLDGRDPETCAEALQARTYIGCDYWPTVTANNVSPVFDFAVVIANTGKNDAEVTVTGPNSTSQKVTVASGALEKIYLPWVKDLKGPDAQAGQAAPLQKSVLSKGGAYHLVSSAPVIVYQFNALEYKGEGGPPGKSWAGCNDGLLDCFSYSNDASLLLPSTAWTTSYRVTGVQGWTSSGFGFGGQDVMGGYIVVTAAQDGTELKVALSPAGKLLAGTGINTGSPGGTATVTLNAGDAVELATPIGSKYDLSGSLVTANKPVQVITGIPCTFVPMDNGACDHVEESVLPAEALGKKYVVTSPTRPSGGPGLHVVRFYGNRDGTTLTYSPSKPEGCPDTLAAGQVAQCGPLGDDFVVESTNEFGVSSFQVGASVYDPDGTDPRGDPSQSSFAAFEQFRTKYLFLAPDDYDVSYAVVVGPEGAKPSIDGKELTGFTAIAGGMGVWRATLGPGTNGAHTLTSAQAVGLQVMGYGAYTSYQYPGGLNLKLIAPPPAAPN